MTWILLWVLGNPVHLGEFNSQAGCRAAVKEILLFKANPPGQKLPEVERAVDLQLTLQREYLCISKDGRR